MVRPFINVTIPVYNEEKTLAQNVAKVAAFIQSLAFQHEIVVVDNGSTDNTFEIAQSLQRAFASVRVMRLEQKGRGGAIKAAWSNSQADILSYMDVDLSTDLTAFPTLIDALMNRGFDLATGSRLLKTSSTTRGPKREFISRSYNALVKGMFGTKFSDAQCGFKAITRTAAERLLPLVEDNGWFMDTELLVIAEKLGYRIFDLPVRWVDDPDSRVQFLSAVVGDVKGLIRLRRNFARDKYSSASSSDEPPITDH